MMNRVWMNAVARWEDIGNHVKCIFNTLKVHICITFVYETVLKMYFGSTCLIHVHEDILKMYFISTHLIHFI